MFESPHYTLKMLKLWHPGKLAFDDWIQGILFRSLDGFSQRQDLT